MKKVCSKCFMSAIAYQAPEVWIPFLRAYPQIETEDEQECDYRRYKWILNFRGQWLY